MLKEGITIITEDDINEWHVRYNNKDYHHPTPEECRNLKEFCDKNNGFYLGYGPFCLLSGADLSGEFGEGIERFKNKSDCKYHMVTFEKWENTRGIGFLFSRNKI